MFEFSQDLEVRKRQKMITDWFNYSDVDGSLYLDLEVPCSTRIQHPGALNPPP
jgi:hypothetical protein